MGKSKTPLKFYHSISEKGEEEEEEEEEEGEENQATAEEGEGLSVPRVLYLFT